MRWGSAKQCKLSLYWRWNWDHQMSNVKHFGQEYKIKYVSQFLSCSIILLKDVDETSEDFKKFLISSRQRTSAIKRHLDIASTDVNVYHGGTLLILPLSLISQWKSEIVRHMTPE